MLFDTHCHLDDPRLLEELDAVLDRADDAGVKRITAIGCANDLASVMSAVELARKSILSYKGVLYKHHLLKGVKKGAFDEAQAEVKFQAWLKEKEAKIAAKVSGLEEKSRDEKKTRFEAETKIREAREAELAKKKAVEIEAEVATAKEAAGETKAEAKTEEAPATVTPAEEPKAEETKTEEPKAGEPKAEEKE